MINNDLRNLIEPNLKYRLMEEDWRYIEDMFSETYLIDDEGRKVVALKPHPMAGQIAILFSPLNGAYMGIHADWYWIKNNGTLL